MNTRYYVLKDQFFKRRIKVLQDCVGSVLDVDRQHVRISVGNKKLGNIPSISLLPVLDCGNCSHCAKSCYDLRNDMIHNKSRNARAVNSLIYATDPERYFREIDAWLTYSCSRAFRWHVGGDIKSTEYLSSMVKIAVKHKDVKFLCFTKMFHIVNEYVHAGNDIPSNLKIIFSGWKGLDVPNQYKFPSAHPIFPDGSTSAKDGAKLCTGNCSQCLSENRLCWNLKKGEEVIFPAH